jgi:hypothetical protein
MLDTRFRRPHEHVQDRMLQFPNVDGQIQGAITVAVETLKYDRSKVLEAVAYDLGCVHPEHIVYYFEAMDYRQKHLQEAPFGASPPFAGSHHSFQPTPPPPGARSPPSPRKRALTANEKRVIAKDVPGLNKGELLELMKQLNYYDEFTHFGMPAKECRRVLLNYLEA